MCLYPERLVFQTNWNRKVFARRRYSPCQTRCWHTQKLLLRKCVECFTINHSENPNKCYNILLTNMCTAPTPNGRHFSLTIIIIISTFRTESKKNSEVTTSATQNTLGVSFARARHTNKFKPDAERGQKTMQPLDSWTSSSTPPVALRLNACLPTEVHIRINIDV